jgi:hypothetical protein
MKTVFAYSLVVIILVFSGCIGQLEKIGCDVLPADDTKDHCYQDAAVRMGDPNVCDKIVGYKFSGQGENPPKDKCFMRIAIDSKDPTPCSRMQGGMYGYFPGECYQEVAIAAKNPKICDMMGDFNISRGFGAVVVDKAKCYSLVGSQPTYCTGLGGENEIKCYVNESVNAANPLLCESVKEKTGQYSCLLEYAAAVQERMTSGKGGNFQYSSCSMFVDTKMKYECAFLGAGIFDQPAACSVIREANFKTMCEAIPKLMADTATDAELTKMSSDCSQMTDTNLKAVCLLTLGLHESLMASSVEDDQRSEKLEIEGYENMLKACDSGIFTGSNTDMKKFCFGYLLLAERPEHCEKMKSADSKDNCFEIASIETGDCSPIRDASAKSECVSIFLPFHDKYFGKCDSFADLASQDKCIENQKGLVLETLFGTKLVPDALRGKYAK